MCYAGNERVNRYIISRYFNKINISTTKKFGTFERFGGKILKSTRIVKKL